MKCKQEDSMHNFLKTVVAVGALVAAVPMQAQAFENVYYEAALLSTLAPRSGGTFGATTFSAGLFMPAGSEEYEAALLGAEAMNIIFQPFALEGERLDVCLWNSGAQVGTQYAVSCFDQKGRQYLRLTPSFDGVR